MQVAKGKLVIPANLHHVAEGRVELQFRKVFRCVEFGMGQLGSLLEHVGSGNQVFFNLASAAFQLARESQ